MKPWETAEYKAKMLAEFEMEAPHFHCDGCLEIVPVYLGKYPKPDVWTGQYCHACAARWYDDDYESDGEEWKQGLNP